MMKKRTIFNCIACLGLLTPFFLFGCRGATPPVQFFTLSPAFSESEGPGNIGGGRDLVIGLGPLTLPQYLDRSQIVTRTGPNRLEVNEFQRWAGTLEEDFMRVLTENISFLTGSENIELYPFRGDFDPDYRVKIKVLAFEGAPGDSVRLKCMWTLDGARVSGGPVSRTAMIEEPAPGGFDTLAAAKSKVLGLLSRQIVNAFQAGL